MSQYQDLRVEVNRIRFVRHLSWKDIAEQIGYSHSAVRHFMTPGNRPYSESAALAARLEEWALKNK